ncbi:hypothetical protein [Duganella sp. HH101]|uniref:hypothetical protein n=1 Tax=Duganella sp. HH101 TaxID=1781066 RepID=UPI000893A30B|nr:hypothetical protein [Duganella sp. HH101]OFA07011.1 hypothetical protein DUGA2_03430 [Duganella sp. HH101]
MITNNSTASDEPDDAFLKERAYYLEVGTELGSIVARTTDHVKLDEAQLEILVLMLKMQKSKAPGHISAMLTQLIAAIVKAQR